MVLRMINMRIDSEYKYAVIQFLEQPRANIDDYVCIPHSWIRMRRAKDRKTTVAFPDEPWLLTKFRIKKGERPSESWKVYMAVIKYETYSYNDARFYIMEKNTITSARNKYLTTRPDNTALPYTTTDNVRCSFKRITMSERQLNTVEEKIRTDQATLIDQIPKIDRPTTRNVLYPPRNSLILKNDILHNYPELDEDSSLLFLGHLQNRGSVEKEQNQSIFNDQARDSAISIPQYRSHDHGASSSFIIQNQTYVPNQSYQSRNSPVYQDSPLILPTQVAPERTSEMELTYQTPSCSYSSERQDFGTRAIVVDEPIEASCNEEAIQSEQSTENEAFASINCREIVDQSCQPVVMEEKTTTTDQVASTQELLTDENVGEKAGQPTDSLKNIRDRWKHQLAGVFTKMACDCSYACEVTSELHLSFVKTLKVIKRIKDIYESHQNESAKETSAVTPKDVIAHDEEMPVGGNNENNQAKKSNEDSTDEDKGKTHDKTHKGKGDNDDDDENNSSDDESTKNTEDDEDKASVKTTCRHIRSFVLPAEYNPDDTRWTLKYREPNAKLGLVELMPRTKVYINSIKLSHCKRVAKDTKTLARMLLVEIFDQKALSVCSLTGARANAFDVSRTKVRPGLDEHARMVILNFVEEHARQKNWGVFDVQSVINSIRSKIQEIRAKYGKTL